MNILILNWRDPKNPKAGGAEIVTMEHAKAWVKAGHKITWFTSSFSGAKNSEIITGVEIIRRGNAFTVYMLAPFFYLFSGRQFDLVIDEVHGIPFFTPFYVRKPKIAFIHEVAGEIWDYMFPYPFNIVGKLVERIYLRIYKNIPFWTDAPSTVEDLVKFGVRRQLVTAIPCPINNKPNMKLPVKNKDITFIFVSRLVKMKGIEEVLEAYKIITSKIKNANLWIVGDGDVSYVEKLKKVVIDNDIDNRVKFWGRVSEAKKLQLMRSAHLLLHASVKEGWGLVVMEAASLGTPSVVYNVAGLRDVVKTGDTGIIVKSNTPQALASEALNLISNRYLYKRLQKKGIRWASGFHWVDASKDSLELIKKAVTQNDANI